MIDIKLIKFKKILMSNYFSYLSKDNINEICNYLDEASKYMLLLSFNETSFMSINKNIIMNVAAQLGYINIIKIIKDMGYKWDKTSCAAACLGGQLETLKWLKNSGCKCDNKSYKAAGRIGNINIIIWLTDNRIDGCFKCCHSAAKYGQLNVLQWYNNEKNIFDCGPIYSAVKGKQYEILEWLINHTDNKMKSKYVFNIAASVGDIKILEILKKYNFATSRNVYSFAIRGKNLEVIKWLKTNGIPYDMEYLKKDVSLCDIIHHTNNLEWLINNIQIINEF